MTLQLTVVNRDIIQTYYEKYNLISTEFNASNIHSLFYGNYRNYSVNLLVFKRDFSMDGSIHSIQILNNDFQFYYCLKSEDANCDFIQFNKEGNNFFVSLWIPSVCI